MNFFCTLSLRPLLHFFLLLFLFHPLLLLSFYLFHFPLHLLHPLLLQPHPILPIPSSLDKPFLLELSPRKTNTSGTKCTYLKKKKTKFIPLHFIPKLNFFFILPIPTLTSTLLLFTSLLPKLR